MSKSKAQSIPSTSFHKQATSDESELPEGWAVAPVGDILGLVNGCPFKPSHWKKSGLPIIRIQNLNNPNASFNYCTDEMPEKFRVRNGDLLFAWSGTPGTSFGAHVWDGGDAWLNQHIFRVEFNKHHFDRTFLKYSINRNLAEYIEQAHGGAGLAHITKGMFEKSLLPIAPLAEQCRIVAKLEVVLGKVASLANAVIFDSGRSPSIQIFICLMSAWILPCSLVNSVNSSFTASNRASIQRPETYRTAQADRLHYGECHSSAARLDNASDIRCVP